jgi:predicted alpha/beta-fold hydrolase
LRHPSYSQNPHRSLISSAKRALLSFSQIRRLFYDTGFTFLSSVSLSSASAKMFSATTIDFTAADETVPFFLKNRDTGGDGTHKNQISLLNLAKSATPECSLNPLLFSGHLHTAWAGLTKTEDVEIHYKRRIWESDNTAYPGQFTVDFVVDKPEQPLERDRSLPPRTHNFTEQEFADFESSDDSSPMLVVLHGLSGGSHEQYLRHALRPLVDGDGGWSACVVNSRGCSWSKITTPFMFNARATWDIRQVVKWLRKTWPKRRLYAVGFSLGANILCNYLGEEGEDCQVESAVLVCNPWNLDVANTLLRTTWLGENVYLARMGAWMKKLFERYRYIDRYSLLQLLQRLHVWQKLVLRVAMLLSRIANTIQTNRSAQPKSQNRCGEGLEFEISVRVGQVGLIFLGPLNHLQMTDTSNVLHGVIQQNTHTIVTLLP